MAGIPHCDSNVLHAPGKCKYCDEYPEWQQERIDTNVNFTGESDPDREPDPATQARNMSTINAWAGNQPVGPGVSAAERNKLDRGQSNASRIMYGPWKLNGDNDEEPTPS